jgi:addiction module HigA family antidote
MPQGQLPYTYCGRLEPPAVSRQKEGTVGLKTPTDFLMTNARTPAEVFPPGDFIRKELEARHWTQSDLAAVLGRPLPAVNEIINGKKRITAETAKALALAFGTSAELWLNLENN